MSDYYDPTPRIRLERPIVLAGQIGCGAAVVAWQIAAQTGLSFVSIDRLIEHEAGRELARLAVEEGITSLLARTDAVFERVAREVPFGLVVLDRSWPSAGVRDTLRSRTCFIHLRRSEAYLARQFDEELRRAGDWILRTPAPASGDPADLPALLAHREALLREAEIVFEADELHPHSLAQGLLETLDGLAGA